MNSESIENVTNVNNIEVDTSFIEPILDEKNARFSINPLEKKYDNLWQSYKTQQNLYWKAEEVDFSKDYDDFITMSKEEQHFIKMILAFFAQSDGIVNFNLRERFLQEIKITEAQVAYGWQQMIENIHNEVYSNMLVNIIKNSEERASLLDAINTVPSIKKIADWTLKWIKSKDSIGHRIIAFCIVEGVFFSSAFAAIFWLKKNKPKLFMEGLLKSNRFIARDESMHAEFACALYSHIVGRVPQNEVFEMFDEAVNIGIEFSKDAIQIEMIGMNLDLMGTYIKYVADIWLSKLKYDKLYNVENPFDFMDQISLLPKDNFFETRPDAYQSAYNENNKGSKGFSIEPEF